MTGVKGTVEKVVFGGSGLVRNQGKVVFVPFTAPDDTILFTITQEKKQHAFGKCEKILTPSKQRTVPICPYFETCGACQFQHIGYKSSLEIKKEFVQQALERALKIQIAVADTIPSPKEYGYRAQITLKLQRENAGYRAVYTGVDPNEKLAINSCPIFTFSKELFEQLTLFLKDLSQPELEGGVVKILKSDPSSTDERFIASFSFYPKLPIKKEADLKALLEKFPLFSGIYMRAPGQTIQAGNCTLIRELENLVFSYLPTCFTQTNEAQSRALYSYLLTLFPAENLPLLDLYCGIGMSSLLLAKNHSTVVGVELNRSGIDYAKLNAKSNKIDNATFFASSVEDFLRNWTKRKKEPVNILLNPPREGLSAQTINFLKKIAFKNLVYISCNPATLGRDLALLKEDLTIQSAIPWDFFPQTTHIETVVHCTTK